MQLDMDVLPGTSGRAAKHAESCVFGIVPAVVSARARACTVECQRGTARAVAKFYFCPFAKLATIKPENRTKFCHPIIKF